MAAESGQCPTNTDAPKCNEENKSLNQRPDMCSNLLSRVGCLHECNCISFKEDAPDTLFCLLGIVNLGSIIQNQIHVLVEAHDATFDRHNRVVVKPDLDSCPVLQEAEDQVDRLRHDLEKIIDDNDVRKHKHMHDFEKTHMYTAFVFLDENETTVV
eukprot:CAMPEP_0171751338 /NCGR_PEP_ID=MMETSP0991-20121206/41952_2 /TAXON_ID=483369 /ORGANISM="non described non described, Strain CCMP2098" /LENGTH=155 /DNA_ID=CAMNT_0012352493 /DNA_START=198 /DNA_END=665 /DNA_ORIENTATION=-